MSEGFYKELEELQREDPEATMPDLLKMVDCTYKGYDAATFLAYSITFALALHNRFGYQMRAVFAGNEKDELIHCFCMHKIMRPDGKSKPHYLDVRGDTTSHKDLLEFCADEIAGRATSERNVSEEEAIKMYNFEAYEAAKALISEYEEYYNLGE